jgi:hypothetical protein
VRRRHEDVFLAKVKCPLLALYAALADGPVSGAEVCSDWCTEDQAPVVCLADCEAGLLSECYYSGKFKLLLPAMGSYDLTVNWDGFCAAESAVGYNSSILLELLED